MNKLKAIMTWVRFKLWSYYRMNHFTSFYTSHSQFGEDMIIRSLLGKENGFYLDIGAHHPIFYSNTYHFYLRGWRGVNVDANPGSMKNFNLLRPKDINIEVAINPQAGDYNEIEFHRFKNQAYNTMDESRAETLKVEGEEYLGPVSVKVLGLDAFLKKYKIPNEFEILTIDIEGLDKEILKKWDFSTYRPKIICFEDHEVDKNNIDQSFMIKYLKTKNYELRALVGPSIIMSKKEVEN